METIYLVGQISIDDPRTYEWRRCVRDIFRNHPNFEVIDPCSNGFNQKIKNNLAGKDINRKVVYNTDGIEILPPKDLNYVMKSTIALADLNIYDPDKMIIGSFFELAWYYLNPQKTVIGIYDGDPSDALQCKHPFVWKSVTTWVHNHKEACDLVLHYFDSIDIGQSVRFAW